MAPPPVTDSAALDFVFSCSLCVAAFSDIYKGHTESVQGLSDGLNPTDRLVTKLYTASCGHVVCTSHLDGGGVPFHAANQRPSAPCPVCVLEKGDHAPKVLFSVRGFKRGEYDDAIPASYFAPPAVRESEGIQFQYAALLRCCKALTAINKQLTHSLADTQSQLRNMETIASEYHAKQLSLQQDNEQLQNRLESTTREYQGYLLRKQSIEHYLRMIPSLVNQNKAMDKRLAQLGFRMPLESLSYKEPFPLGSDGHIIVDKIDDASSSHQTVPSSAAGKSVHTLGEQTMESSPLNRPKKRQRIGSPFSFNDKNDAPLESRDMGPPRAKPLSRMRSIKRIFPSIKNRFSNVSSIQEQSDKQVAHSDTPMCRNEYMNEVDASQQLSSEKDQYTSTHSPPNETPYMSGALPVAPKPRESSPVTPGLLPSVGVLARQPEFTFRSHSPVKMSGAVGQQLAPMTPEPSYIRLMDGLSGNDSIQLGLQDPRHTASSQNRCDKQHGQDADADHTSGPLEEPNDRKRWQFGHAFSNQSSKIVSSPGKPSRKTPDPVTPAPHRFQRPTQAVESVVSPYFRNTICAPQLFTGVGVAELEDSIIRSGAFRSPSKRASEHQTGWHEPRSLNGLSFFDTPRNQRNQPIDCTENHMQHQYITQPYLQPRNLDSQGLLMRPRAERSFPLSNNAHRSIDRSSNSRKASVHHPSTSSNLFSNRSSHSRLRAPPLPPAMPSVPSSKSPVRSGSFWDRLGQASVRNGRQIHNRAPGSSLRFPARNPFMSSGRRTVQR